MTDSEPLNLEPWQWRVCIRYIFNPDTLPCDHMKPGHDATRRNDGIPGTRNVPTGTIPAVYQRAEHRRNRP